MLVREAAVLGTSGHPGEALAACGPRASLDGWRLTTSGCLELDAIRRPVPSTEAPCQHRGMTAVRSRRQRFWPVPASAKRTDGSLVGVGFRPRRAAGRVATPNQGRPPDVVTRSRPSPNLVLVCARHTAGTPGPCPPRHRFRRRPTRRSRCRIRCRRPTPCRPESRTRSRRLSSDAVSHRRTAHGRAACHLQVYSSAASGRQSNSREAQTGHMIATLVGSTPSGSSPVNAAQDLPSSSLTQPHSSHWSTAGC